MPKGIYERKKKYINLLIKRNKSKENREKVSTALKGHKFTEETLQKMRDNHADFRGEKNPNWRGNDVGMIGIHRWLTKNFKKERVCEFCGKENKNMLGIDWALLKGKAYERKRENFIELCRSCHAIYDGKGKVWK